MRIISDPTGVKWTVFEVKKQGGGEERWSYLPDEFGNGWLCFESASAKRRLTPIPLEWQGLSDANLVQLLAEAKLVNRPSVSLEDRPSVN
jgi:hypothetical protein